MRNRKPIAFGEKAAQDQQGFSLLEVLISMVVLAVGLVALLGVFGVAIAATQTSQEDMIAKELASQAMESVFTSRDSSQLVWAQVNNVSNAGIFADGFQSINNAGPDGIFGTADDAGAGPLLLKEPGPDGISGTSDDISLPLTNYQRSISIQPIVVGGTTVATLRTITVTIQYYTPQFKAPKTFVLTSQISQFR